jgi:NitT/TauT family transport system substrate-binding protein
VHRVTLAQEYFHPWPNSAGFYLARSRGWYADAGIDLELRTVDPGRGDALEYLHRCDVDFGVFPSNRLLMRRERGQQLVAVAAVNQRGLETLRTTDASGIERLRDLEGRRIAYNPTARGHAVVRSLIASDGGDPDNYTPVDVGARELDPVDGFSGLADATYGSYWAWDNLLTAFPQERERVWRVDETLGLGYHSYLLGAREEVVRENPQLVADFAAITRRGFETASIAQDEVVDIYERITPYFPERVIRRSVAEISTTWLYEGRWGALRHELLEPYARWLASNGILTDADIWRESVLPVHGLIGAIDTVEEGLAS